MGDLSLRNMNYIILWVRILPFYLLYSSMGDLSARDMNYIILCGRILPYL